MPADSTSQPPSKVQSLAVLNVEYLAGGPLAAKLTPFLLFDASPSSDIG
jgi:hypothetical protein